MNWYNFRRKGMRHARRRGRREFTNGMKKYNNNKNKANSNKPKLKTNTTKSVDNSGCIIGIFIIMIFILAFIFTK